MKVLEHPVTGGTFKMGRKKPISFGPKFRLRNYLKRDLPDPPPNCDYRPLAASALANIYGNDKIGNCTIAGIAHTAGVLSANAGDPPLILTLDQIIRLYSACSGYDPKQTDANGNNPTDNGCNEITVLNYWQNFGLLPPPVALIEPAVPNVVLPNPTHKIAGWMTLRANDPVEVRIALWLFENLYFGVQLPDAWISPMPGKTGFVWDKAGAPDPDNGHCFVACAYNPDGIIIDTWGMTGLVTNAAMDYATGPQGGELYVVISTDAISKVTKKAPNGFDWSQLVADFDSMGGGIPVT